MSSKWKRLAAIPLLALTAVLWSCEGTPTELPLTATDAAQHRGRAGGERVPGSMPSFDLSETIGPEGGSLGIEGYTLTVPKNAVRQPTVFTFTSVNNGYIQIKATATAEGSSDLNDVGRAGFAVPVQISLSYHAAGGPRQWLKMVLAHVRPDGELEYVPSRIDVVERVVTGSAAHFSEYVLAVP